MEDLSAKLQKQEEGIPWAGVAHLPSSYQGPGDSLEEMPSRLSHLLPTHGIAVAGIVKSPTRAHQLVHSVS